MKLMNKNTIIKEKLLFNPNGDDRVESRKVIEITSELQKWVDQGISMELYIDANRMEAIDIYNLYFNAWRKKCKTVYYVRQLKLNKEECLSCAN